MAEDTEDNKAKHAGAETKEPDEDSDSEDDDAISIDFGKIKNIFKKAASAIDDSEDDDSKGEEKKPNVEEHKEEVQPETPKEELLREDVHEHKEPDEHKVRHEEYEHKEHPKAHKPKVEVVRKYVDSDDDSDDDSDAISFDFSKIKSIFKPKPSKHKAEASSKSLDEDSDEDISIDFKKIMPFFKKYGLVLLILIPIFMCIFFRVQPAYLPVTDEWATNSVHNYIRNQVSSQINQQYPNLPEENKNVLINEQFNKVLKEQKAQITQQIEQTSDSFKARLQDESGQTYLLAIDPYFWLRHVNNVRANGHPGDKLVDGKPYNTYMYAPVGRVEMKDMFHAYFSAYFYKIVSFFNSKLPVKNFFFFVPVIISALSIIPVFFIARRVSGNLGGLFAGILVAVHSGFLTRTAAGFSDTDAYNIMFPLWVIWLLFEAFETKNIKLRIGLAALAGFLTGIYSTAWGGWWYILDFLLAAGALFMIYYLVTDFMKLRKGEGLIMLFKKPVIKNTILILLVFFVVTSLITVIFSDFKTYIQFIESPGTFVAIQDIGISGNWPNVFTTVAEQNVSSFQGVMGNIGGKLLYIISIVGLLFTLFRKDIHGKMDIKYAIVLIIWMIATTYASIKGVRYILLLVPAVGIGFGIFVGTIYNYVSKWTVKELHINKWIVNITLILVLGLLLVNPIKAGWYTAQHEMPSMNDAWYGALSKIDAEAEPDAIINSWWDFGHWFKMIGNRAVTFDGTSQNTPMAHWVGLSLLTNNEDLAVGILRMLDCGSRNGYNELNNIIQEDYKSTDIMYEILPLHNNKGGAKEILLGHGLTPGQAESVLKYTHCDAPQNYYITSNDMIGKSGVWAHFGSWNFRRATMFNMIKGKGINEQAAVDYLTSEFNYTESEAQSLYFEISGLSLGRDANDWIAPWPGYSGDPQGCSRKEDLLNCGGMEIDISNPLNPDVNIPTPQGTQKPYSLVYAAPNSLEEKVFEGELPFTVALVPDGKGYFTVLMQPPLGKSMFTTMFYYEGHGLRHFKLFDDRTQISGGRILVWNVSWDGGEPNVISELVPKTEVKEGDEVTLNYIGWDDGGEVFDSSIVGWQLFGITNNTRFNANYNYTPLTFISMAGQVVPGFDKAIVGMNKGEEKVFDIPPEEAYGTDPALHLLGNKTLHFKVRVVGIE